MTIFKKAKDCTVSTASQLKKREVKALKAKVRRRAAAVAYMRR